MTRTVTDYWQYIFLNSYMLLKFFMTRTVLANGRTKCNFYMLMTFLMTHTVHDISSSFLQVNFTSTDTDSTINAHELLGAHFFLNNTTVN